MRDLEQAKALLSSDAGYTCVLCGNGQTYTSALRGVAPMVDFLVRSG